MVDEAQHVDDAARPDPDQGAPTDDAVEAALLRLGDLARAPVREHVAVFEAIHGSLQDRLADPGE